MNHWQLGRIFFDTTRRVLVVEQQQHYLEPRIYDLLLALLAAEQHQLSRDQLIEQVWQGRVVSDSAINRAVSLLRKALSQLDASQPYLETLPKVGYRLVVSAVVVAPVTLIESPSFDSKTEHKNQHTDKQSPLHFTEPLNQQLSTSLPGQTTNETAPQLLADDKNSHSNTPHKTELMQRRGWWISLLLLLLLVFNLYWLQHSPQQSSEPKSHPSTPSQLPSQSKPGIQSPLPIAAVPKPQTSDNGIESQLSLSRDGQWFSYLQQDGDQSRWFLQKSGQQFIPAAEAVTGDFSNAAANASASELAIGSSRESTIKAFEDGQRLQIVVPEGALRFTSLSPDRQWLLYELCQQELCQLWQRASPVVVSQQSTTTGIVASSAMKPATTNVTTSVKTIGTTTSTIPSPIQLTTPVSKPLSTPVSKPLSTSLSMTNANGAQPLLPDRLLLQLPLDSQLQISWQQDSQAFYFRQRPDKTKPYVVSRFELATMAVQQLTLPVTEGGDMALAISADATKLAVAGYLQQAKSVLKIYQRQTMALLAEQEVPFAVTTMAWQNDDQLLFGCAEQLCRWSVSTQQVEPLFYTGAMVRSLQWQPSLDSNSNSSSSAASSAFGGHLWYATAQQNMSIWRQPRADVTGHWPAPEPVVAGSRIDWMPRVVGEDLVFLSNRQGEQQIWRKVAGQSEQRLAKLPPPAEFVRMARSEDGAELVYSQQGAVYLLDINSGHTEQILDESAKAQVVNFGANKAQLIYSSNQSGDWQLWSFDRQSKRSRQLTTHGGYSGYYWQGELWYSKYHRDGLYRLDTRGQEQHMLSNFDKINWLNWQLLDGEVYFYQPDQGLMQWSVATPEQAPRLVLPTPTGFMHHYQWTRDALWYVKRATAQGDIYQLALPADLLISKGLE